jgi:hypothetical protein
VCPYDEKKYCRLSVSALGLSRVNKKNCLKNGKGKKKKPRKKMLGSPANIQQRLTQLSLYISSVKNNEVPQIGFPKLDLLLREVLDIGEEKLRNQEHLILTKWLETVYNKFVSLSEKDSKQFYDWLATPLTTAEEKELPSPENRAALLQSLRKSIDDKLEKFRSVRRQPSQPSRQQAWTSTSVPFVPSVPSSTPTSPSTCTSQDPKVLRFMDLINQLHWDSETLQSFLQVFRYLESLPSTPLWRSRFAQGKYIPQTTGRYPYSPLLPSYLYLLVQMHCPHLDVINKKLECMLRNQRDRSLKRERFPFPHRLLHEVPFSYNRDYHHDFGSPSEEEKKRVLEYYNGKQDEDRLKGCYDSHLDDIVHLTHLLDTQRLESKDLYALLHLYEKERGMDLTPRSSFRGANVARPRAREPKERGDDAFDPRFDKPNLFYTILDRHCPDLNSLNQYLHYMKRKKETNKRRKPQLDTESILHYLKSRQVIQGADV